MPKAPPSLDGRARGAGAQAAEVLVEPDDDVVEDDEDADEAGFASDEEPADDEDGFDAGLLLDEEPRESLR
ncbi:hypothetical protein TNCT1_26720 [Streptomyces sp. 1-11]|nr:hypothetical protein TNCT1_26720 [Streptomyces sp. 1-11]